MNQRGSIADTAERGQHLDAIVSLDRKLTLLTDRVDALEKVKAKLYEQVNRLRREVAVLRDPEDDDSDVEDTDLIEDDEDGE